MASWMHPSPSHVGPMWDLCRAIVAYLALQRAESHDTCGNVANTGYPHCLTPANVPLLLRQGEPCML